MIKVADFGLSVAVANEKNYFRSESVEKLPVKWMAPESLLDRKFSELSDVVSHITSGHIILMIRAGVFSFQTSIN